VETIKLDHHQADLSIADRAMLTYAEKLTLRSHEITTGDVQALRDAGFADEDIHDVAQIVAYFHYINRVCDGLGVKREVG
jgi:uncharacterized peroxidase-related enzyme